MTLKEILIKQFNYCNEIAKDILANEKSAVVQEYAKQFAEIESPLVGGTDCEWIRINYGDIYIFLHDDGNIEYQLDPYGQYGAEIIDVYSEEEFWVVFNALDINENDENYSRAYPDEYIPIKRINKDMMRRIGIVMKALDVEIEDAEKIVKHLTQHNLLEWIDDYDEDSKNGQPLVDVHYESTFEDMINWKYEDTPPFDMLGKSSDIKDYPELLELKLNVIFWYNFEQSKKCMSLTREELTNKISKEMKLDCHETDILYHDLGNLRGEEWILPVSKNCSSETLKQLKDFINYDEDES